MERYEEFNPTIELVTDGAAKGPECNACAACAFCPSEKGKGVFGTLAMTSVIGLVGKQ